MSLSGKRVLVTGASSGLGAHFVAWLAGRGARVVAGARRLDVLEALAAGGSGRIAPVVLDVADASSVEAAVAQSVESMGGLDGVINNAGISWGGRTLDMKDDDWRRVIDVNLNGVFRVATATARAMAGQGGGAIVNTASILGFGTGLGLAAYAASKAAVVHLTRNLALEWARHDIRVNAMAPGYFPTEMNDDYLASAEGEKLKQGIPMRRFGRLEDLEGPMELLLTEKGAYITGVTLPVDGGHLVRAL